MIPLTSFTLWIEIAFSKRNKTPTYFSIEFGKGSQFDAGLVELPFSAYVLILVIQMKKRSIKKESDFLSMKKLLSHVSDLTTPFLFIGKII